MFSGRESHEPGHTTRVEVSERPFSVDEYSDSKLRRGVLADDFGTAPLGGPDTPSAKNNTGREGGQGGINRRIGVEKRAEGISGLSKVPCCLISTFPASFRGNYPCYLDLKI